MVAVSQCVESDYSAREAYEAVTQLHERGETVIHGAGPVTCRTHTRLVSAKPIVQWHAGTAILWLKFRSRPLCPICMYSCALL